MSPKHTRATLRIQRRLEALELEHLRALVQEQGERIEALERENRYLEDCADMWQRGFHDMVEAQAASDTPVTVGLTQSGHILVGAQSNH